jgi:hypothetical protein
MHMYLLTPNYAPLPNFHTENGSARQRSCSGGGGGGAAVLVSLGSRRGRAADASARAASRPRAEVRGGAAALGGGVARM